MRTKIGVLLTCSSASGDACKDGDKHSAQLRYFREALPDCYCSHKIQCTKQWYLTNRHKAKFSNWQRRKGQCCVPVQLVLPTSCRTMAVEGHAVYGETNLPVHKTKHGSTPTQDYGFAILTRVVENCRSEVDSNIPVEF